MKKQSKSLKRKLLKKLVRSRKLKAEEKLAVRIGYMGSGLLVAAQWTIKPELYIIGFICIMIQTTYRKQWNLVALNINGLMAWIIHYFN